MVRAEILAVGSEMLTPDRVDTNSLFITERLNAVGIDVAAKSVVADDRALLADVLRVALDRVDLVVVTGGLGPTSDDLTREALADVLGVPLEEDPRIVERLRQRFARRGVPMPENNRKQAQVPRGAVTLPNEKGTAPGLLVERAGRRVIVLPGPPREMKPMLERVLAERYSQGGGGARVFRRVLKTTGRAESQIEEMAHPIYARWAGAETPIRTTILATPGQIELHLSVRAGSEEQGRAALDAAASELVAALGAVVFATDAMRMEEVVGNLLRERRMWIATAESCTGGLLCSRLTDVPGSSDYVERGVVCYSNRAKTDLLGVPDETIREHGAVSEPVAIAMARGVRERAGVDIGVGISGIAGPAGGTVDKPVGTVVVAIAWPDGEHARTLWFPGDREQVKVHASQAALDMVRRLLLKLPA
jgi:nicotinamide-nucleotide amidase